MEVWSNGGMEQWIYGDDLRQGNRMAGGMELWSHPGMELWSHGAMGLRTYSIERTLQITLYSTLRERNVHRATGCVDKNTLPDGSFLGTHSWNSMQHCEWFPMVDTVTRDVMLFADISRACIADFVTGRVDPYTGME